MALLGTPDDNAGWRAWPEPVGDIALSVTDRDELLYAFANIFSDESAALMILRKVRFPRELIPAFRHSSLDFWLAIFQDIELGAVADGYRRLLLAALRPYPRNRTLSTLAERYLNAVPVPWSRDAVGQVRYIEMSAPDRDALMRALAKTYSDERAANTLLTRARYPRALIPKYQDRTTLEFWYQVFSDLEAGAIANGFGLILDLASREYPGNVTFSMLTTKYFTDATELYCHVVVRASTEDDREQAKATISALGLEPATEWITPNAISFRVGSDDREFVAARLRETNLGWTVAGPTEPDYVLGDLYVYGPDGRRFRFSDVPAGTRIQDIAGELLEQYDSPVPAAAADALLVAEDSTGRRLDPQFTLGELAVEDDEQLRVSFETRAGGPGIDAPDTAREDSGGQPSEGSESTYLEHAVDEIFEEAGIEFGSSAPALVLAENQFLRPSLRVVQLTAGEAFAVLELHDDFWTYYWKCSLTPADFARRILRCGEAAAVNLTVVDGIGDVLQVTTVDAVQSLLGRRDDAAAGNKWTLLRFDGPERSWAWQRMPGEITEHRDGRRAIAYLGCASTANHGESFRLANELLASSAVDASNLLPHIHLLEHYITRWGQGNWKVQPQSRR